MQFDIDLQKLERQYKLLQWSLHPDKARPQHLQWGTHPKPAWNYMQEGTTAGAGTGAELTTDHHAKWFAGCCAQVVSKPHDERSMAAEQSTLVNHAYTILRSPLSRANYMVCHPGWMQAAAVQLQSPVTRCHCAVCTSEIIKPDVAT